MEPTEQKIFAQLKAVLDPELRVPITELGMVRHVLLTHDTIVVDLVATFLGCPALGMIQKAAQQSLMGAYPDKKVSIHWDMTSPWTPNAITPSGRDLLRTFGIAVADSSSLISCPYCGFEGAHQKEGDFGTSLCRALYYCNECHSTFEVMKHKQIDPSLVFPRHQVTG